MNGKHWENQVESGDEADVLNSKEESNIPPEAIIDIGQINTTRDKNKLHLKTKCVQCHCYVIRQRNTSPT